jgi:AcrR family transcriptional regulator
MPKPRTVEDEAVLGAAAELIAREGPAGVTFARVGTAVGLSPATLVQRFGSKRDFLLALSEYGSAAWPDTFAAARAARKSPLAALLDALARLTEPVSTPAALANSVAFLQLDLSDPDFHRIALAGMRRMREQIEQLLAEAVSAGELKRCDTARLARAVQNAYNGGLITWGFYRQGKVDRWVRDEVELLLKPFRPTARGR